MRPLFPAALRWAPTAFLLLAGCRQGTRPDAPPPPAAEFVLSAGDSSFWVTSANGSLRVRGAPLQLAVVDGRLYELYVADDDRSFENAVLIGQRVYRRDLQSGDSLLVYQDTLVPRLARQYARLHPDDAPLGAADDPSDEPAWTATSTLDLGDLAGPFLSYTVHTDVERDDAPLWHTSRRGVLDIRNGRPATLSAVAGSGRREVERARALVLGTTLDSVRAARSAGGVRAAAMLPYYRLDPSSFTLTTVDGAPAIAYALPGAGLGDAGHLLALAPIPLGEPSWWSEAASSLPVASADGQRDVWRRPGYEVVVRYDSTSDAGRLALRDSTSREWSLGRVPAPATRVMWLDRPPLDPAARRSLDRAFDESSLYDTAVRTAAMGEDRRPPHRHRSARPRARPAPRAARPPSRAHRA